MSLPMSPRRVHSKLSYSRLYGPVSRAPQAARQLGFEIKIALNNLAIEQRSETNRWFHHGPHRQNS